jgi:DNA-binding NarL/FixJ family response regulator
MIDGPHAAAACGAPGAARFALRVAVIHGNKLSRDLLGHHCVRTWDCNVVACESDGEDGVRAVARDHPDLIILGHALPHTNAIETLPLVRKACPTAKSIILVPQLTDYLVRRLGELRPQAVVEECSDGLENVETAISRLRDGGRWLTARYSQVAAGLRSVKGTFAMLLTDREQQVLVYVAHAMIDEEIAQRLRLTPKTVRKHRTNIARKLNLRSAPHHLIRFAVEKGFQSAGL